MTSNKRDARYTVQSYDNYRMGDGGDWMTNGRFDSADEAIACAQGIIDKFLNTAHSPSESADSLYLSFLSHGEVPCIFNEDGLTFEPYKYLKRRIKEITGQEPSDEAGK